jgi:hypothetical protein
MPLPISSTARSASDTNRIVDSFASGAKKVTGASAERPAFYGGDHSGCAGFDLAPARATLLCAVRNEPRQMADLAASWGMTKNALSQLVDRAARLELVGRESWAQDRRVVMLSAPPAAKVLGEAVYAEVAKHPPAMSTQPTGTIAVFGATGQQGGG